MKENHMISGNCSFAVPAFFVQAEEEKVLLQVAVDLK
jgi:hypothetical protein